MTEQEILKSANDTIVELKTLRRKTWDGIADKCVKYTYGDQWSDKDKRELLRKKRPVVHDNMILPAVDAITGFYLQSRADLVAKAVDQYSDINVASMITSIFKHIDANNIIDQEDRFQFQDGLITGVGIEEIYIDTQSDFEPNLKVQWSPCKRWYLDPFSVRYDYTDMQHMMSETRMSKDEIEYLFGKKIANKLQPKSKLESGKLPESIVRPTWDDNVGDYGNVAGSEEVIAGLELENDGKYQVNELYRCKYEKVEYYVDPETNNVKTTDKLTEDEYAFVEPYTFTLLKKVIRITTVIEGTILAQKEVDTEAEEFYHIINVYRPYLINGKAMGVVENATDPQDDINKRSATELTIIMSHSHVGERYEEGAYPPDVERQLGSLKSIGANIKMNEGGLRKREDIYPKEAPNTLKEMVVNAKNNIQYITGAADAIQGIAQRRESGRAKEIEYQRAAGRLSGIIENMRFSQTLRGRAYLFWIQKKYTSERMFRIIGADGMTNEELVINKRDADKIANDVTTGKYDITLSYENKTQVERERNLMMMRDIQKNMTPEYQAVIAKWILALSDIPQKEQIVGEVNMVMQQQQQIQQMQQMQQQIPANR